MNPEEQNPQNNGMQPDPNQTQAPVDPNANQAQDPAAAQPAQEPSQPDANAPAPQAPEQPANPADPGQSPTNEEVHQFRKEVDASIQKALTFSDKIGSNAGADEIYQVVVKLKEAKMWAGKILEAFGSPFPAELADKA